MDPETTPPASPAAAPRRELTLFDSTCLIVGVIVGSGIFRAPPLVAEAVPGTWSILGVWLAGGLISLAGALCYAELASAYPRQGGDYVYLSRAFGGGAGFLFGWAQMFVILPGGIATVSFILADYARPILGLSDLSGRFVAAGAIVALTLVNILGVRHGKWTQNVLTAIKAAGLLLVVAVGLLAPGAEESADGEAALTAGGVGLALVLVLFAYGGWSDVCYVAAEVREPGRNFVRAMVAGTVAVTLLYLLVNGAYLHALGPAGVRGSEAVAVDTVAALLPGGAERAVSVLVCLSALGAVNGLVLSGSRISYAMGTGHAALGALGKWHPRLGTPVRALVLQGILSAGIVLAMGSFIEALTYAAPVVWAFYLVTGISVFVLRARDPDTPRPYRVTGYPLTPLLLCAACILLITSSVTYAWEKEFVGTWVSGGIVLAGAVFYAVTRRGRGSYNP